ncbi:MAG: hypothetical protein AAB583_01770, partial [Patescibacteria group bacterium]
MKLALTIPGIGNIDSSTLPPGIQTGGIFGTGERIISVLIQALIISALGFALYIIVQAAFNMMTSGGDKERFAHGRERLRYAIIGLFVIFFSFFIINLTGNLFGVQLIKFTPLPDPCPIGIYCAGTCYSDSYIEENYPPPLCGAECTIKNGIKGLYPKECAIPTPVPTSVPTQNPTLSPIPTPDQTLSPTPPDIQKTFFKPGETINKILPWPVTITSGRPAKRMIDCIFKGGDSKNIKTEIRLSNDPGKIYDEGEEISFPNNVSNIDIRMLVRPGASPTCFEKITCNLISREPGSTG